MILHTLNALPDSAACADCLDLIAPGDTLLLLGDGCYVALQGCDALDAVFDRGIPVRVLAEDATARGIATRLQPQVASIDMAGFVALTEHYPRQQAWY